VKKECSWPVSRVLFPTLCSRPGVCHLSRPAVTDGLNRSTLCLGRAALKRQFTRTFNSRPAQPADHPTAGGLLPHLLTLTRHGVGRLFSSACGLPSRITSRWEAGCSVLPGLSSRTARVPTADGPTATRGQRYAYFLEYLWFGGKNGERALLGAVRRFFPVF
jgi:hypothetical protein